MYKKMDSASTLGTNIDHSANEQTNNNKPSMSREISTQFTDHNIIMRLTGAFRAKLYNMFVSRLTAQWYAAILEQVPAGSTVLDVGI